MNEKYKLNKEWLDLLLEHKNNANITFNLSNNDTRILLTYIEILQQENKQLKMINKEYERLNKEKNRGFKITNVQEYNIDKLLSYKKYKDNWNILKEHLKNRYDNGTESISYRQVFMEIREAMQVLEIAQELEKRE